jgi:putative protease
MKTELLSPAGSLKGMKHAFAYGADAVYAGQPRYSLRVRNNEFSTLDALKEGIDEAHRLDKKFYLAANIAPHNAKVKTFLRDIQPVIELNPDALIMSDPGLIMMVREHFPDMPVHLSVQANVVNYAGVKFWHRQGIERVILSRELSLDEVEEIRMQCPEMELEVFVHGALCIAYSGRCLLSGYFNKRDPNQGTCTNACRWKYQLHDAQETETGDIIASDAAVQQHAEESAVTQVDPAAFLPAQPDTFNPHVDGLEEQTFLLQEASRPGEYMPIYEDEHGTYIMNSRDLRAVQHVERLVKMGVHSLKIEGRTKSPYYVARTAQAYRKAIDDAEAGRNFDMGLMDELESLASRGYTEGFYRRHVHDQYQNYDRGNSLGEKQQLVGDVVSLDQGKLKIDVKNKFAVGDKLELVKPSGNVSFDLTEMINKKGEAMDYAPGSGHVVDIPAPEGLDNSDQQLEEFGMLVRYLK